MRIKKYEASTEQTAMEKIKEELGSDAIILSIKTTQPRGLFAFLRKPVVEVTAAYEERFRERANVESHTSEVHTSEVNALESKTVKDSAVDFTVGEASNISNSNISNSNIGNSKAVDNHFSEIFQKNKRIIELEEVIRGLQKKIQENEEVISKMTDQLDNVKTSDKHYQNSIVQLIYDTLTEQGVLPRVAAKMLEDAASVADDNCDDIELITKIVYNAIIQSLGKPCPIDVDSESEEPIVAFFLGPTGAGKTTTIAKLTSLFILSNNLKVGLITADTYRIAAVEQLKVYGEILGINVNVVYKSDDLRQNIDKLSKSSNIVLIDTAGRSHKNGRNIQELKELLDAAPESRKFLVMNITTKYEDILNILDIYSSVAELNLIFTKLDETSTFGSILNICCLTGKGVSYVTYGQNVPDDIEVVQPDKVAKSLLGFGENFEGCKRHE